MKGRWNDTHTIKGRIARRLQFCLHKISTKFATYNKVNPKLPHQTDPNPNILESNPNSFISLQDRHRELFWPVFEIGRMVITLPWELWDEEQVFLKQRHNSYDAFAIWAIKKSRDQWIALKRLCDANIHECKFISIYTPPVTF